MTTLRVRVIRTDDGETLLERILSVSEYLELLKKSYPFPVGHRSATDDCESGDAYDALIEAEVAPSRFETNG